MEKLTQEQIIEEINQLRNSPYVKLARKTQNGALKQKLYQLRSLDKKGRQIAEVLELNFEDKGAQS